MTRACALFDSYRDKELGETGRMEFESHLADCESCRARIFLLDAVVHAIKQDEPQPVDLVDRIVERAFKKSSSWEILVAAWFRPRLAFAFIGMIVLMIALAMLLPVNQIAVAYTEYMQLMEEAEASNLAAGILQVGDDGDLVVLLEQGGDTQ
ncbi:MAG TPA: zf-HC2 domain-containing protein [Acidobacteriota bacterium]|nr:zf-HC2 domain-containing protein [Acidobacteriota bacterium]